MAEDKPAEKPTVAMPAVTDRALLEDVRASMRNLGDNVGSIAANVTILMEDRPVLHSRLAGVEGRMARLESPSLAPPKPLTSERVRAIADDSTSKVDLELQSQLGQALGALAEEKAKREALEAVAVTKADVKKFVDDAATVQTEAIVSGVKAGVAKAVSAGVSGVAKNPMVRKIGYAAGALALQALALATAYLALKGH